MSADIFDFPLCETIVAASPWVAVHSQYAAELVARRCHRHDITVIPMGMPLYLLPDQAAARGRLGLPTRVPVVASLGQLSPHKRLDVALRAFRRVRGQHQGACFVIAGAESPGLNLDRQISMLGLEGAVARLGYIAEASVPDLLAATDVVINLRYPTAGETSASLLRILAAGKATIASRAGSMAEVAPGACATVLPDDKEEELVALFLDRLLDDPPLRHQMEANARRFILDAHQLAHSAAAYLGLIERITGHELQAPVWPAVEIDARAGGPDRRASGQVDLTTEPPPNWLADRVAVVLVELGLEQAPAVVHHAASALVALGIAPGSTLSADTSAGRAGDADATASPAIR
jgi:glycosyltransferase involved in cell wall biosynthesis